MKHFGTRAFVQALGLMTLGMAAGCQAIIGVESRDVDPIVGGCALPSVGDAKIRFGNLVPSDVAVDICVRSSGGDYGRPVLRGGGSACIADPKYGFKYSEVTAPFAVKSGKIDLKVIKGGDTCKGAALTEVKGVDVPAGATVTLLRMGNAKIPETIKAYTETTTRAPSGSAKLRVIHASPGSPALDWAVTSSGRLPVDLPANLFLPTPMAFGEATNKDTKPSIGKADANGYIELVGTKINLGAAPTGTKRAVLVTELPGTEGGRSIIAIGDPSLPFFPVRALVCNDLETDGLKTKCTQSALGTLSIDVFNAYLYGPFAPDEDVRRPFVLDAIASRTDGEVMCVTALSRKKDQDSLIQLSKDKGTWPYSIQGNTNLDTPANDPNDPSGAKPTPYTIPPCGGTNTVEEVNAAFACIKANCSTPEDRYKGDSTCLSSNCASVLIPFIAGNKDQNRCFNCISVGTLADKTLTETQNQCLTDTRDYKAFDGATSSLVLSKFPIRNAETYVLPSTSYQRVVHYGQVEIEKDKYVDFFCGELSAAFGDLVPYYGHYAVEGKGDPWEQEQVWQANLVVKYVQKKAEKRPAIITGEWAASREFKDGTGKIIVDAQGPQVIDALEKVLIPALPKDFVPFCTECAAPANPYNGDKSVWQFRTYVYNMPTTSGVEIGKFFTDSPVPIGDKKWPISDRWGFNTRVLRP